MEIDDIMYSNEVTIVSSGYDLTFIFEHKMPMRNEAGVFEPSVVSKRAVVVSLEHARAILEALAKNIENIHGASNQTKCES